MASFLYNLLLLVASPGLLVYYLWRVLVARKSNESWRQNLGALPRLADREAGQKLIWMHAASVGEVVASQPIQEELRRIVPGIRILLTTITQTGNAMARKSAGGADTIAYFPLDFPLFIRWALNRVRPDAFVIVETEMWPNFLASAKRRGIPTIMVNGRISDRSFRRSRRWRWLMSWAASNVDACYMQTETDADRIRRMGARLESVKVVGSTKFDQEGAQLKEKEVRALRIDLGLPPDTPVFIAGSTNPGEDEPVISAFEKMRNGSGDLRMIIAPRQIERADEIQSLVEARGLKCVRRSQKQAGGEAAHRSPGDFDVLVLDTFGELAAVYAAGQIAFVGGTLIPKGGHSLVQPILQGKPVFFGPYTFKTRDMAQMALSCGVGFEVRDANELAERASALLPDDKRLGEIGAACSKLVADNKGASSRCAEVIAGFLSCAPTRS